jgi:hypothetical protein
VALWCHCKDLVQKNGVHESRTLEAVMRALDVDRSPAKPAGA